MIAVRFDERTWGRLASLADEQGITVAELIEHTARRLITGTTARPDLARERHREKLAAEIVRLREQGHTIRSIAHHTGYSKSYVSRILIDHGHRTYKTTTQHNSRSTR